MQSRMNEKRMLIVCFIFFLIVNAGLAYVHEPWRDEVHAWLMAKNMSIPELIAFSGYEGHPVLWHIMLMPLAKSGLPVWTMNVLSYLIVAVSAYMFMFRTDLMAIIKIVILFTFPFLYIYSSVARNYCIVLFGVMWVSLLYKMRFEHPLLYSIPIVILVFSHALAWGFVAGLTLTFHIYELAKVVLRKSNLSRNTIVMMTMGLLLIGISTLFVIVTMLTGRNAGYTTFDSEYTKMFLTALVLVPMVLMLHAILIQRDVIKESIVILCTFLFQVIIYTNVYSSVMLQRVFLLSVFLLFYLISTYKVETHRENFLTFVLYFIPVTLLGGVRLQAEIESDIVGNYSSAQEMAEFINKNLADQDIILVDSGIFEQTIVPYTDKMLYDIVYQTDIEHSLYHTGDYEATEAALQNIEQHEEYRGKYLIVYDEFLDKRLLEPPFRAVYRTNTSLYEAAYTLFYIEKEN